jgi:D-aminoacyl-tRNA deacylase
MRALLQRVSSASVSVDGAIVGAINRGLLLLVGVGREDTPEDAAYLTDKVLNLRIFPDAAGRFDRSILDIAGDLMLVSQFTLYADTRKGRRPSFTDVASPDDAAAKFLDLVERFRASGLQVATGQFQAMMDVALINDGPVTILLDSADRHRPRS